jgi:hypothetical protein
MIKVSATLRQLDATKAWLVTYALLLGALLYIKRQATRSGDELR